MKCYSALLFLICMIDMSVSACQKPDIVTHDIRPIRELIESKAFARIALGRWIESLLYYRNLMLAGSVASIGLSIPSYEIPLSYQHAIKQVAVPVSGLCGSTLLELIIKRLRSHDKKTYEQPVLDAFSFLSEDQQNDIIGFIQLGNIYDASKCLYVIEAVGWLRDCQQTIMTARSCERLARLGHR